MFVADFNTLRLVYFLDLFQDIVLYLTYAGNLQQFFWIDRTFGDLITGFDLHARFDPLTNCL